MTIPRIRPVVFREPSSGEIVTTGMTRGDRRRASQIATRLVTIAAILLALALVAGVVWIVNAK